MVDSKEIQEWYGHPPKDEGQGVYVMIDAKGESHWCSSGNELRRVHEISPSEWLTGPIYMTISAEDKKRLDAWLENVCDNW